MSSFCKTAGIQRKNPALLSIARSSSLCFQNDYPFTTIPTVIHYAMSRQLLDSEPLTKLPNAFARLHGRP